MHRLPQLVLDRRGGVALSAQLVTQLRDLVLTGMIGTGERVPGSRALAQQLGVARSVVVAAYEQLLGEGFFEATAGSGTRVAAGPVLPVARGRGRPLAEPVRAEASAPEPEAIDLVSGRPYAGVEPPRDWRRAQAVAARLPLRSDPPDPQGDPRLRAELARHAERARGIRCGPADVLITAGTSEALLLIALAMRSLADPPDPDSEPGAAPVIAVENPGYPTAHEVLRAAGARVRHVPVGAEGMTAERLAASVRERGRVDAALVTPSHQYPLGGRLGAAPRLALLDWAEREGAVLLEDDYDSEYRYAGALLPAIASLDSAARVLHIGSLNKTLSPSVRCGYLVLPGDGELRRALWRVRAGLGATVSAATQAALAEFLASGGYRRYVARTRREYRHRRAAVLEVLGALAPAARLSALDGGLHAVLELPPEISAERVQSGLTRRGVRIETVADLSAGPGGARNALVIGYGAEPVTRLRHALEAVVAEVRGRSVWRDDLADTAH